jgi:hypothetical protein
VAAFGYAGDDRSDTSSPYTQHYLPTAEIWKLYLRETEAEDKELAQLWQIGLDQLLIFVRKFAFSVLYECQPAVGGSVRCNSYRFPDRKSEGPETRPSPGDPLHSSRSAQ